MLDSKNKKQKRPGIRIVFTGSPGAGKTTTATAIHQMSKGIGLVPEAATRLMQQYRKEGMKENEIIPTMIHTVQQLQYEDMQTKVIGDFKIFDRSVICSLVYDRHYGKPQAPGLFFERGHWMRTKYSFSSHVFCFELGKQAEYTQKDEKGHVVRFQTYAEAKKLQKKFADGYEAAGFKVHLIPWMNVDQRVKVVMQCLYEIKATAASLVFGSVYPNFTLCNYWVGMNDEGGRMCEYVDLGRQRWTNLSVVLDRPYVDGIDYDDIKQIKQKKKYAFKESAIPDFNEPQVGLAYLMIMKYYIQHAHELVHKKPEESVIIILHAFRQRDGDGILLHLSHLLNIGWPELENGPYVIESDLKTEVFQWYLPDFNTTLIFSKGKADKNFEKSAYGHFKNSKTFAQADLILGFSVHIGLHQKWGPGTLVIPNDWTPIDVDTMKIKTTKFYKGGNHLMQTIDKIVNSMPQEGTMLERLQKKYHSQNQDKHNHIVLPLERNHFKMNQSFIELGGYIFTPAKAKCNYFQFDRN